MQRRSVRGQIRQTIPALCLSTACLLGSGDLLARDVQVGRYASLIAAPTEAQTNLLSKMATVKFPSRVKTVGEAIQHLLRGSGYRLAGTSAADPARFDLLNFLLPMAHRFQERFGIGSSRQRRIAIVALARRLLIDLWRFMETGAVPDGARLKMS